MEEWWVSSAAQKNAEELQSWSRPYKRFRAAPHDVWLMSQPVFYQQMHVWVADTGVFTLPAYRLAGISAPANAEFSTQLFNASALDTLWLNLDAQWHGGLVTGGCDEVC